MFIISGGRSGISFTVRGGGLSSFGKSVVAVGSSVVVVVLTVIVAVWLW